MRPGCRHHPDPREGRSRQPEERAISTGTAAHVKLTAGAVQAMLAGIVAGALALAVLAILTGCAQRPPASATQATSTRGAATPATQTPSSPQHTVVVFAASSLKEAFEALGSNLEKQGVKVEYNLGGSQALAAQLAQGARADVFASADLRTMQSAIDAGVIVSGTQRVLATNRLVVVTQGAGTGTGTGTGRTAVAITDLHDLMRPGLRLVLADRTVPVGNYSLQMLDRLAADPAYGPGFKERVLANVVSYENNVRQVLAKVQLGEADAGIVYATDASTTTLRTIPVPDRYSPLARYYIAPLKDAPHPQAATVFITYALSDEGQQILQNHGFGRAQEGK